MICTYEPSDKDLSKSLPHGLVCNNTGGCDYEIPTSGYWRSDLAIMKFRPLVIGVQISICVDAQVRDIGPQFM